MTDTRFTTVVDDTEELLNVVDIDEIGDVETLLMFLFARTIGVEEVWNEDRDETSLEVVVQGNDEAIRKMSSSLRHVSLRGLYAGLR